MRGQINKRWSFYCDAKVLVCFSVAVVEGLDIVLLSMAAPKMAQDLDIPSDNLGVIFSVNNLAMMIGALIGGCLSSYTRHARLLLFAVLGMSAFTILTAYAQNFVWLLIIRGGVGLFLGLAVPNLIALSSRLVATDLHFSATTFVLSGVPLGGVIAGLIVNILPERGGWEGIFQAGGLLSLIAVPATYWLSRAEHSSPTKPSIVNRKPSGPRAQVKPEMILILLATVLAFSAVYLILSWLPFLLVERGMTLRSSGTAVILMNALSIAGANSLGRGCDQFGAAKLLAISYALVVAVICCLAVMSSYVLLLLLSGALGFLLIGSNTVLISLPEKALGRARSAVATSLTVAAARIGSIIGPFAGGVMLSRGYTEREVLYLPAVMTLSTSIALTVIALYFPQFELARSDSGDGHE